MAPPVTCSTRSWRRTVVLAAVVVLLIAEVGLRLVSGSLRPPVVWENPEADAKWRQMSTLAGSGGASTVFIGSSLVGVGFDPSRVSAPDDERPAYNAALLSSALGQQRLWLEHFVLPLLRPSTVVIGVSGRELNANDATLDLADALMLQAGEVRHALGTESLVERADRWLRRLSYLARYREVLREPTELFDRGPRTPEAAITDLGLTTAALDLEFTPFDRERLERYGRIQYYELSELRLQQLRTMVESLTARGIEVVIVNMPVTAEAVAIYPRGPVDLEEYSARLEALAAEAGAAYLPTGVWPTSLFADEWHVNGRGTAELTTMLAASIRS